MLKKYTVSTRTKLGLEFRFSTFQKVSLEKYKMSFHLYWLLDREICCCPQILNLSLTMYLRSFGAAFVKLITKLLFQSLENFIPERCDPFLLDSTPANFFSIKMRKHCHLLDSEDTAATVFNLRKEFLPI